MNQSAANGGCALLLVLCFVPQMSACAKDARREIGQRNDGPREIVVTNGKFKCPIRLQVEEGIEINPEGFVLEGVRTGGRLTTLNFYLKCVSSDEQAIHNEVLASYDKNLLRWVPDLSRGGASPEGDAESLSRIKASELRAANSDGVFVTIDDDPLTPGMFELYRSLSFCLRRPPVALCGGGRVKDLSDPDTADATPNALQLIQSIEFLD